MTPILSLILKSTGVGGVPANKYKLADTFTFNRNIAIISVSLYSRYTSVMIGIKDTIVPDTAIGSNHLLINQGSDDDISTYISKAGYVVEAGQPISLYASEVALTYYPLSTIGYMFI